MKKTLASILLSVCLFSCVESGTFSTENIIPTPKELTLNGNRLYPVKEVVVLDTKEHLVYPSNQDEYYIKSQEIFQ